MGPRPAVRLGRGPGRRAVTGACPASADTSPGYSGAASGRWSRWRTDNKNGWKGDDGARVIDTAGVAGPSARYMLAIMDELPAPTRFRRDTNTLAQISALLFQGGRASRPNAEATRDLGGCTQAGRTVTIRKALVVSVRKRGASVP